MKTISFNSISKYDSYHILAFYVLKSYLSHKGIAKYFDFYFNLFFQDTSNQEIADKILSQKKDITAFSVQIWNYHEVKDTCRIIKQKMPDTFILLGGPYAGFMADYFMSEGLADLIVRGAGEDAFFQLMDKIRKHDFDFSDIPNLIYRKNGKIIKNKQIYGFDLSMQNYPLIFDAEPLEHVGYEASRGCPNKCRYCTWSDPERETKLTFYPVEKVKDDLTRIYMNPKIKRVFIIDSDLFLSTKRGLHILNLHKNLNAGRKENGYERIFLECQTNPERLNDKTIKQIGELDLDDLYMGCGLQSINEEVNNVYINRKFNKKEYIRKLNLLQDTLYQGVGVSAIYGIPGDNYEGFRKTVDFLLSELKIKSKRNYASSIYRLRVLPGSYFRYHADDFGLVFDSKPPCFAVKCDTFSEEDMAKAKQLTMFVYIFYTVLKEIRIFVEKKVSRNRLNVYEKIIEHIIKNYPDFVSVFVDLYKDSEDTQFVVSLQNRDLYIDHIKTRRKIIKQAKEIVNRFTEQE